MSNIRPFIDAVPHSTVDNTVIGGTVMIHQPHMLPWVHYLARMSLAEAVVFLDNVPFRKGYFQNRTSIRGKNGQSTMVSLPIERGRSRRMLSQTRIFDDYGKRKLFRTTECAFKDNFRWRMHGGALRQNILRETSSLARYNIDLLVMCLMMLRWPIPRIYLSSSISSTDDPTGRIVEICRELEYTKILCGWGASTRIHDSIVLDKAGLSLIGLPNLSDGSPHSALHEIFFAPGKANEARHKAALSFEMQCRER